MLHSEVLRLLTPLALGSAYDQDIALEGGRLDLADLRAGQLLSEVFPNTTYELIDSWERNYASAVFFDDPLQVRQAKLVQKMSELGRLDVAYFIQLAAAMGYAIVVEELHPFMSGWGYAGDELGDDDSDWCWRVYYSETDAYVFRAGESSAGECLSYTLAAYMAGIFEDLKPADTFVEFI